MSAILFPVCRGGKWGYINQNGDLIVPIEYKHCAMFSGGVGHADTGVRQKYFLSTGQLACESSLPYTTDFSEGLCVFHDDDPGFGKCGYFDLSGEVAITARYDFAYPFQENVAVVEVNSSAGLIDRNSNWLIELGQFDYIGPYSEGMAPASVSGRWGYVNNKGEHIVDFRFDRTLPVCDNALAVLERKYWGFIDRSSSWLISPRFTHVERFSEGLAPCKGSDENLWGFINKSGEFAIPPRFTKAGRFSSGLAAIYVGGFELDGEPRGGKWGYCNSSGELVIETAYDEAEPFQESIARVGVGGSSFLDRAYGYITTSGDWIWRPSR